MRIAIAAQTNRITLTKAQIEGVQKSGDTGRDLFGAHPPALVSPGLALPVRTEYHNKTFCVSGQGDPYCL